MLKRPLTLYLFVLVSVKVLADSLSLPPDYPPLRSYHLEGLTRTRPGILKPYLDPYLERPFSPALQESMVQSLRSLGIFHTVRIDPLPDGNGGVEARVYLEEKWTLVPIPLGGATSGGSLYGGLILFESNLFGLNKKFYGGGFLNDTGWRAMLGYIDPRFWNTKHSLFLGFSGGEATQLMQNTSGKTLHKYAETELDLRGEYTFPLRSGFSFRMGFQFKEQSIDEGYEESYFPPEDGRFLGPTFGLRYQDLKYGSVLVYGTTATLRYEPMFDLLGDDPYNQYTFLAQRYTSLWGEHRLGVRFQAQAAPDSPFSMDSRVDGIFLKTVPDHLYSDTVATVLSFLEILPFHFRWGAPTFVAFYEGGVFREDSSSFHFSHGPGVGFRLYLSRIVVPAFGFDLAYSWDTGEVYGFVNVGMQM